MNIQIQANNLELTEAITQYIEKKIGALDKLLGKWEEEGSIDIKVEVAKTTQRHRHGNVFYAEVLVTIPGKTIRAQDTEEDLFSAIDKVKDKLQREIKKYKEKKRE